MAVMYAKDMPIEAFDPVEIARQLSETMAAALPWLESIPDAQASTSPSPGKWCAKQVIGHLIDSAINNQQRIVRLETAIDDEVASLNYEQEDWVVAQRYADREWVTLLDLWRNVNEHIAWTIRHVSRQHLGRTCVFPDTRMSFGFLMEDYVAHLEHHVAALKVWL